MSKHAKNDQLRIFEKAGGKWKVRREQGVIEHRKLIEM